MSDERRTGALAVPVAPAAPPEPPPYVLSKGLALGAVGLLLGITQGLGVNLINSNLTGIQGALGATATEASWLTTAYFATNISASLLLTKVRYQYGLRRFDPASFPRTSSHAARKLRSFSTGATNPMVVCMRTRL